MGQESRDREVELRRYLLGLAHGLAQCLRPISENLDKVLRNIEAQDGRKSTEGMLNYLAPLRVATLFSQHSLDRIVFEEPCSRHPSRGPHDVVLYTNTNARVVNEIKRLTETLWSRKQKEAATDCAKHTELLHERWEDSDKSTGSHDIMLKEIWEKRLQLDPAHPNVLWLVSSNDFYDDQKVDNVAHFLTIGREELFEDQPGRAHQKPEHLTALGWLWDAERSWTTERPHVFLLESNASINLFLHQQQRFAVKQVRLRREGAEPG